MGPLVLTHWNPLIIKSLNLTQLPFQFVADGSITHYDSKCSLTVISMSVPRSLCLLLIDSISPCALLSVVCQYSSMLNWTQPSACLLYLISISDLLPFSIKYTHLQGHASLLIFCHHYKRQSHSELSPWIPQCLRLLRLLTLLYQCPFSTGGKKYFRFCPKYEVDLHWGRRRKMAASLASFASFFQERVRRIKHE